MAKRGGFPGGGMPGNMANLMKQAQKMQRQMCIRDSFIYILLETLHQLFQTDISRSDPQHRRDSPMEYMIHSVIFSGLFICCQISWSLHYHDGPLIPFRIAADRAKFPVRQSTALCTVSHIISGIHDRLCQILHLIFRHIDNMKCQSLGRLCTNTRKA